MATQSGAHDGDERGQLAVNAGETLGKGVPAMRR